MKILLKNATVVNVLTDELIKAHVLLEDDLIIGVGDYYCDCDADVVEDVSGKYICPGFIDGHIHIESTMLSPAELARVCVPHGTTTIMADPHEIANVSGINGVRFMLEASEGLPMTVNIMLPSCVPASPYEEPFAPLHAEDLRPLYEHPRVQGLGEMMDFPGVIRKDADVMRKIADARAHGKVTNGHAPLVTDKALDAYISAGIYDDHECTSAEEAKEHIRRGQWAMVRQGTVTRNLMDLLPLFDEPWNRRCLLVCDDRHPADLLRIGHIDSIIRLAVESGKSAVTAIRMATLQAAQCFGMDRLGAVAPGYIADVLVLDDLDTVKVRDVYHQGKKVVADGKLLDFATPKASPEAENAVRNSIDLSPITAEQLTIKGEGKRARVIKVIAGQALSDELITDIDLSVNNGIDTERDILKIAVIERHHNTGHIGLGYIHGIGLKKGALAATVSHDSHNLIVVGTDTESMVLAANHIRSLGGGNVVVADGKVLAEMPLPLGGLMTDVGAEQAAVQNNAIREAVHSLGVAPNVEPFMNTAFISLSVIPHLKITTTGLVAVNTQQRVPVLLD